MKKILFCIPSFIIGFLFFLVLGCNVFSIFGGLLFSMFALQEYQLK